MRFFSTILAFGPLIACMPTTTLSSPSELAAAYTPPEALPPAPTPSKKVVVLKGTDVSQPVEIIGLIDVHAEMKDQDHALEALKAKAGSLGADAVLDVEYHHAEGKEPSHLSGTAVRFNDLLKGREYDTIGPISATFEMGEEEDGLRALKEKARQVGASLILGVKFDHGEGAEKPRVFGTAIRFKR